MLSFVFHSLCLNVYLSFLFLILSFVSLLVLFSVFVFLSVYLFSAPVGKGPKSLLALSHTEVEFCENFFRKQNGLFIYYLLPSFFSNMLHLRNRKVKAAFYINNPKRNIFRRFRNIERHTSCLV